jgi:hypothetical protein
MTLAWLHCPLRTSLVMENSFCISDDWLWTSVALPEAWNDGDDIDYTYHGAAYQEITLCKLAPFVLQHLASPTTYWNESIVTTFVMTMAYHINITNPSVDQSYFLTPRMLSVIESCPDKAAKMSKKLPPPCKSLYLALIKNC